MERIRLEPLFKFNYLFPMSIKAVIIEDEKNNVDLLKHFVAEYCDDVQILGSAGRVDEAVELIKSVDPQIIFLDIVLEKGTGFDILDQLKELRAYIIFVTAFDEHAIRAFKCSAIDYLLKPLQIDQLVDAVDRAKKLIDDDHKRAQLEILLSELNNENEHKQTIAISMIDSIEIVKLNTLLYIEADGKYSSFHLMEKRRIVSSKNIGEYEKLLSRDNDQFVRVHNSFIVNTRLVESIQKRKDGLFCILTSGLEVPISRRKRDKLNEILKK